MIETKVMSSNEDRIGYKKTKAGWIPEDWACSRFIDLVHFQRGFDLPQKERKQGDVPVYASNGLIGYHKVSKVSSPGIVTGRSGSIGKVSFIQTDFWPLNTTLYVTDFKANDPLFAYYFMYYFKLERLANGTGVPTLNRNDIHPQNIPLPPLFEQEAIAEVLDCWDKAIQEYEKKIERKKNIKNGLMQRLLSGKQRLPGFSGEWKIKSLDKGVTKFIVPMRDKPKKFSGTIPWCRIDDFEGKYLSKSQSNKFVDQNTIENMNLKIHPQETVLVSCSANLGICSIVKAPLVTNQTFIGLVTHPQMLDNDFLYYQMTFRKRQLNVISNGTTISYLSRKEFERFRIPFPTLLEQRAIASVLSSADSEIKTLEKKLGLLREQKRFLLNNLVTGTIRLPEYRDVEVG